MVEADRPSGISARERRDVLVDELIGWMIDGARPSASAKAIIRGICDRLVDIGVPIDRFALFIFTLHPNLQGRRFRWFRDGDVDIAEAPMGMFSTEIYTANPIPHVIERKESIRRHLEDPDCPDDYLIVGELREQGLTDYLAVPLVFTTGETHVGTWSTARPGGFGEDDVELLEKVAPPLARLAETYMLRLNAITLLSSYIGRDSGQRVLEGQVHRGDGEEISAVILFVDLKNFTSMSNRLPGRDLVDLLNDAFDILVPPVVKAGGEILKFMGDGFLAIFPYRDENEIGMTGEAALRSMWKAGVLMAEVGPAPIAGFRCALHYGAFHFGNIGGGERLDFTVIGPPVNYAARLLAAAAGLDCDRVLSEALAEKVSTDLCGPAGEAGLKGFDGRHRIWKF